MQLVGVVAPANYSGKVVLNRTVNGKKYSFGTNGCDTVSDLLGDDTSPDPLRDDLPQSGGSNGKVYDLDAPGTGFQKPVTVPIGTKGRVRQRFNQFATLDKKATEGGPRISDFFDWCSRVSVIRAADGTVQLLDDAINDNRASAGGFCSLQCQ